MADRIVNPITPLSWPEYTVLVVDDELGMRSFLAKALASRCARVETLSSVEEAEQLVARMRFDLIILDITLPGRSGVDWLGELREKGYTGDVILITAFADLDMAIHALRAGASDFLLKPFRLPQMLNAIQRCHERSRLLRENFVLRREIGELAGNVEGLVGNSEAIRQTCALIKRIAPMPSTVLILGESGTGKEVAARALHRMSPRSTGPFVPLNCAAVAAELMESELFGHVRGAYTGAQNARDGLFYYANGGTLFLDEVAEMPLPLQAKLLRAIEERKIRPVGSEQEIPVECVSSPPPTATWPTRWPPTVFAATSITVCKWSRYTCRRCANMPAISRPWSSTSTNCWRNSSVLRRSRCRQKSSTR